MSSVNNNTTKTYGSKKPSSVLSGFSSFFSRSTVSSFNDRPANIETSNENDDWFNAFNDAPTAGKGKDKTLLLDRENNSIDNNTDTRILKETKGETNNKKRDGEEGTSSSTTMNRDTRRPAKDIKALLSTYSFEELERTLRILDTGHQQFNKYLGIYIKSCLCE